MVRCYSCRMVGALSKVPSYKMWLRALRGYECFVQPQNYGNFNMAWTHFSSQKMYALYWSSTSMWRLFTVQNHYGNHNMAWMHLHAIPTRKVTWVFWLMRIKEFILYWCFHPAFFFFIRYPKTRIKILWKHSSWYMNTILSVWLEHHKYLHLKANLTILNNIQHNMNVKTQAFLVWCWKRGQ